MQSVSQLFIPGLFHEEFDNIRNVDDRTKDVVDFTRFIGEPGGTRGGPPRDPTFVIRRATPHDAARRRTTPHDAARRRTTPRRTTPR